MQKLTPQFECKFTQAVYRILYGKNIYVCVCVNVVTQLRQSFFVPEAFIRTTILNYFTYYFNDNLNIFFNFLLLISASGSINSERNMSAIIIIISCTYFYESIFPPHVDIVFITECIEAASCVTFLASGDCNRNSWFGMKKKKRFS